ncbi:MAG: response regulator with CheY-like receiver domain and winged-helix DNA-binding domain, partial [Pseudarthrobacter sp.]|nr:response regulator with CheY-like receiver domain and winged-helix DNA-binding domain [Pseudarthrobacter sp.]
MAVEAHHPRAVAHHRAAARGLAVWVVPQEGTSPELVAHAARLVLERALKFAPEAEVHWPAAGAATSAIGTIPAGTPPGEGAPAGPDGGTPAPSSSATEDSPHKGDDGASPLPRPAGLPPAGMPPAGLPPVAGPVSHMAVDLAADQVLLDGRQVNLTGVEYRVLRYLVENCSRAIGRHELQNFLDSFESPGASARSIDVYVGRVRRKLGNARHAVATVRGGGY